MLSLAVAADADEYRRRYSLAVAWDMVGDLAYSAPWDWQEAAREIEVRSSIRNLMVGSHARRGVYR